MTPLGDRRRWSVSLATQLQVVLSLVAATVIAVALVDNVRLRGYEQRIVGLYEGRLVPVRKLKTISDHFAVDVVDTVHKVCAGKLSAAQGQRRVTAALADTDALWSEYRESNTSPEDRDLVVSAAPLFEEARRAGHVASDLMSAGDLVALEVFRRTQMYRQIEPLTDKLNQLVDVQVHQTDGVVAATRADLRLLRRNSTVTLVSIAAVALLVALVFSRRLVTSLRSIGRVVRAAAGGDLSRRTRVAGHDELADMAADVDEMVRNLGVSRRELESSERAARQANAAKSIFLSSMSHELRTPLNVILGYTQLMLRAPERPADEQLELRRIMDAGAHLLGLIDDVLSIAKVEAGKLTLRRASFSPTALLRSVHGMLGLPARAKGLGFHIACNADVPAQLRGDEGKLRQVLVNLLGNAVKFTAAGRVDAQLAYRDGRLEVVVSDTGPGISAEEQRHLFEAFYQGAQGQQMAEGTGLGLFISRALVELMGGELHLDSRPGEGTRFHFSLPAPAVAAATTVARSWTGARLPASLARTLAPILVVDDRESNRDVLARFLRGLGARVVEAASDEQALACARRGEHALVFLNLRMQGPDGGMALAQLREAERRLGRPRTPIVAVTAGVIDRDDARRVGFDDVISKPFTEASVCAVLEALLHAELEHDAAGPPSSPLLASGPARLGELSTDQRHRLLDHLVLGEIEAALRITQEAGEPSLLAQVRAIVESFQVDELIGALRVLSHKEAFEDGIHAE
jgi:signal transduction histidine kinase/DNA-binding response OmpR family regulator